MKKTKINKRPRKVNTHAIIGKEKKKPQKNKAPDSQTSQATCQAKEIGRAHRSHSTREAKQNKTNKKNQGSPIKTIKSHDSILLPLLGRGVFTAGFAPARPFPTPTTYKCVGGSRSRKSRLVARRRLASSSSLCQEVMNFSAPCNNPCATAPHRPSSPQGSIRLCQLLHGNKRVPQCYLIGLTV